VEVPAPQLHFKKIFSHAVHEITSEMALLVEMLMELIVMIAYWLTEVEDVYLLVMICWKMHNAAVGVLYMKEAVSLWLVGLEVACESNREDLMDWFLLYVKDVDSWRKMLEAAWWYVSEIGSDSLVSKLFLASTPVNIRDLLGRRAMMEVSDIGHVDVVKLLLKAGADLSGKD
jgi:ankyrin repeat protein